MQQARRRAARVRGPSITTGQCLCEVSVDCNRCGSGKFATWSMVCRSCHNRRLRAGSELSLSVPGRDDRVATIGTERATKRNVIILKRTSEQQSSSTDV